MVHQVIFEPIVKYANEYFVKENSLYLMNYGGGTSAFIAPTDKSFDDKVVEHRNDCLVSLDDKLIEDGTYDWKELKYDLFDMDKDCEVRYFKEL